MTTFKVLPFAVFICLSQSAFADDSGQAPAKPSCHLTLAASVDTIVQPRGAIAIPVSINGKEIRPILDTGSIFSTISSARADELNLKRSWARQEEIMLGGIEINQSVMPDSIKIGPLSGSNSPFLVVPSSALSANEDGLIGGNLLARADIEFDFAHAKFNMFLPDHCPNQVVYWTRDTYAQVPIHVDAYWHISAPITLDGKSLTAIIDTGSDQSAMSLAMVKSLFGIDVKDPAMKNTGMSSTNGLADTPIYRYPFKELVLEGLSIKSPGIDILPDELYGKDEKTMLIGQDILRQLRIYIAYKEGMLYATPAEAK